MVVGVACDAVLTGVVAMDMAGMVSAAVEAVFGAVLKVILKPVVE